MPTNEYVARYPCGLTGRDLVGMGITALVARLDAVIKWVRPDQLAYIERERRVYERLGHSHDGILRYHGPVENGVILQYACNGSIRQYLATRTEPVPLLLRFRWIEQVTATVAFLHSKGVLHGDISCNNIFLDRNLDTKVGDFAGSSIDGEEPLVCYETSHEHPEIQDIGVQSEVFALGSSFYEMMAGSKPYKELADHEICIAYSRGDFPSVTSLDACNGIIEKCWARGYDSMDSLLKDVRAEGMAFSIAKLCRADGSQ